MDKIDREEEKKIISQYIQIFELAKKQRKAKKFKLALESYLQCLELVSKIKCSEKMYESYFFISQCYYKLNDAKNSYIYLTNGIPLIETLDKKVSSYYKFKGKLLAKVFCVYSAMNKFEECANYLSLNFKEVTDSLSLEEKLILFYHFTKELLYPLKTTKKFNSFMTSYINEQNNILYNNQPTINTKLRTEFTSLMGASTKQVIFEKNNLLFYMNEYDLTAKSQFLIFLEKNSQSFNENTQKIKTSVESFMRMNKLKASKELKGKTINDFVNERKKRIEGFSTVWNIALTSFSTVFKPNFTGKNIHLNLETDNRTSRLPHTPNVKSKADMKDIFPSENIDPQIRRFSCMGKTSNNAFTSIGTTSDFVSKTSADNVATSSQTKSSSPFKKSNFHENKRVRRKAESSFSKNLTNRNYNLFLFEKVLNLYEKNKQLRDCDLVKLKLHNVVRNYGKTSLTGKHITYGETLNTNQDVGFIFDNFMLFQHVYLFGICDGHGASGELVADHAKNYISAHYNYIEMDNSVTKRNKEINQLITMLYSLNEDSNVKNMNMIKYIYEKFGINYGDFSVTKQDNFEEISKILKEAFTRAQYDLKKRNFDSDSSGSTVCMCLITGKNLICSNLGDSRAIICSSNGGWDVVQLTKDHKPKDKNEYERIIKMGGVIHRCRDEDKNKETGPYRVWFEDETQGPGLAMSRSFGDMASKCIGVIGDPDIYQFEIKKDDKIIVVASDGVWEYMSNEDVMQVVKEVYTKREEASKAAEILCNTARERWNKESTRTIDDITCVVFFLN